MLEFDDSGANTGQTPPPLNIWVMVTGLFAYIFYLAGKHKQCRQFQTFKAMYAEHTSVPCT